MKFSTKSRYALRLMAELARYAPGTTVSLKEISERQNLSLKYLEQIVTPLARVGLVKSERGSQGGYRLTKAPADYTAGEILRAIEGSVAPIPCLGSETNECPMSEQCFTLPFWAGLDEVINQYIDSVTLEQLAHLDKEGYNAVIAFNADAAMYRVIVSTYADRNSAANARDAFKAKYPNRQDFQGAWLLYRIN